MLKLIKKHWMLYKLIRLEQKLSDKQFDQTVVFHRAGVIDSLLAQEVLNKRAHQLRITANAIRRIKNL